MSTTDEETVAEFIKTANERIDSPESELFWRGQMQGLECALHKKEAESLKKQWLEIIRKRALAAWQKQFLEIVLDEEGFKERKKEQQNRDARDNSVHPFIHGIGAGGVVGGGGSDWISIQEKQEQQIRQIQAIHSQAMHSQGRAQRPQIDGKITT